MPPARTGTLTLRTPETWKEAHKVLVELEANTDGSKALVGAISPAGGKGGQGGAGPTGGGGGGGHGLGNKAVNALVAALGLDRDQVRALLDKLPEHLKKVCLEAANSPQGKCTRTNCTFDHSKAKLNEAKQLMAPLLFL